MLLFPSTCPFDTCSFFFSVIAISPAEEERWLNQAMIRVADSSDHPEDFWKDKSKSSIILQFYDRVKQIHNFFDAAEDVWLW